MKVILENKSKLCNRQNHGINNNSAIIESSDDEIPDEDDIDKSSDSDRENIPNKRMRRCMRFPSSFEDEGRSNVPYQQTEVRCIAIVRVCLRTVQVISNYTYRLVGVGYSCNILRYWIVTRGVRLWHHLIDCVDEQDTKSANQP